MQTLGVARTLAVSSCKGGVGKSSIALRLALALRSRGLRVGLLDVDVHGPSLPSLLPSVPTVSVESCERVNGRIRPIQALGLECMSWGFFPQSLTHYREGSATVLRGPRTARVAVQLALGTQWDINGSLDVLLMDMPPGTGDVHMALLNSLPLSAAVVVSTPSSVALADVEKGLEMLTHVGVPVIGLVENYAWHERMVSKEEVCLALSKWLLDVPCDVAASVQNVLTEIEKLPLRTVTTGRQVPFGKSALCDILDLAKRSHHGVKGFQVPLTDEMAPDRLVVGGKESDGIFDEVAAHVHSELSRLPLISHQQNSLPTGDPSIKALQSWPKFLHRLRYSHYAG